jgi:hypothetical protein
MPDHLVILIAENEEDYVLLIRKAFAEAGHQWSLLSEAIQKISDF